jgi:hypothetical protein
VCHKLGQGDYVCSLHELNKSVNVGEGQGQTKAFLDFFEYLDRQGASDFLSIWTNKEQVTF